MAEGKAGNTLIAFRSGHYKRVTGTWTGDSVWCHFEKATGGHVHINKAEVEYMETFERPDNVRWEASERSGQGLPNLEKEAKRPER